MIYASATGELRQDLSAQQLHHLLRDVLRGENGILWLDIQDPAHEDSTVLSELFGFHPLTIEDCLASREYPKVEDYGSYIFAIVHRVTYDPATDTPETKELDFFLGPRYLVTVHIGTSPAVEETLDRCRKSPQRMLRGADFLAYDLLDSVTERYLPALEVLEDRIDKLESDALRDPTPDLLNTLLDIRYNVSTLHRAIGPQMATITRLGREPFNVVQPETRLYFRDISDLLVRLDSTARMLIEQIDTVLNVYLLQVSNRTNQVMKVLSIMAAVFLPLTFATGVYGMNFQNLPELDWQYSYFAWWGTVVALALGMVAFFRLRHWL
jgi:magnesium transporter